MLRTGTLFLRVMFAITLTCTGAIAQLTDPIPAKIPIGPQAVELQTVASGLVSPIGMSSLPAVQSAGPGLLIADQTGVVRLIQNGQLQSQPFLDLSSLLNPLQPGYDERGLLGLTLSPGFGNPGSPGYGKLYTYQTEPVSKPADFTVPMPTGVNFNHQNVLTEWTYNFATNQVNTGSPRDVLRFDHPQFNHNGGTIGFGPDGYLYIGSGDGGAANDQGNGHAPQGNGQYTVTVLGKVLRIDPLAPAGSPGSVLANGNIVSANGQYSIPVDNPFVAKGGGLKEIYAYGLRNPYSFHFDQPSGRLILGDVGQNSIEEVDVVTNGGNYGWHLKEGTFSFAVNSSGTGIVTANIPGTPNFLTDPVLEYDHDEGIAVIGGFVYHGSAIPALNGKYIFGDLSTTFASPSGRLFYGDLATGQINQLIIGAGNRNLGIYLKGFGQDANGELYVLGSTVLGPSGTGGVVYQIVQVPEPATVSMLALGGVCVMLFRRRPA